MARMTINNLHKLSIIYAHHIRVTLIYAVMVALAASLGFLAAHGIAIINQAVAAQDRLPVVERMLTDCLNGRAMQDDDGMLINCGGVRSVKVNLVKGL